MPVLSFRSLSPTLYAHDPPRRPRIRPAHSGPSWSLLATAPAVSSLDILTLSTLPGPGPPPGTGLPPRARARELRLLVPADHLRPGRGLTGLQIPPQRDQQLPRQRHDADLPD